MVQLFCQKAVVSAATMSATRPSPFPYTIRQAKLTDVPALHSLIQSSYRSETSRGWCTEAHLVSGERISESDLREIIAEDQHPILVADTNETELPSSILPIASAEPSGRSVSPHSSSQNLILGCIQIQVQSSTRCLLGLFAVLTGLQSKGIGGSLMTAAEAQSVCQFGASIAQVWVITERSDIMAMYLKRGYVPTGKLKDFVLPHLSKKPDLKFAILEKPLMK